MAKAKSSPRTFGILVAALGGEGGGVLTNWLIQAISRCGYYVQSTSIPGVAQRTGGTTYYIEFYPVPISELGDRRPNLALTPMPGQVDVVITSELVEAARAVQGGFVDPNRTTLIASSHRVFAIAEKIAMGDGIFDSELALKACHQMAKRAVIFDMEKIAAEVGTVISSVMLGGLAGTGAVPIDIANFEDIVANSGRAAEASLAGYRRGFEAVTEVGSVQSSTPLPAQNSKTLSPNFADQISATWPLETQFIGTAGVARLIDYQNEKYAALYLERMVPIIEFDKAHNGGRKGWQLTKETARYLALRMSFEDIMRVAYLKTRKSRFDRIREEANAGDHEPVQIIEFLKPGPEELCALLPVGIGNWLMNNVRRDGNESRYHMGMHIRSDTISGFLTMRMLASLRRLRKGSWRYAQETAQIETWLGLVQRAAKVNYRFGVEVSECANLVKGYGNTYRQGVANFNRLMAEIVMPAIDANRNAAKKVAEARDAALADPDGKAFVEALAKANRVPARSRKPALAPGE